MPNDEDAPLPNINYSDILDRYLVRGISIGAEVPSEATVPRMVTMCQNCMATISEENPEMATTQQGRGCKQCVKNCAHCGNVFWSSNLYSVGHERWCVNCASSHSAECGWCSRRHTVLTGADGSVQLRPGPTGSVIICNACADAHYWLCTCGNPRLVDQGRVCRKCGKGVDGKEPRCACGNGTPDRPVHNYSCKPKLVFRGKSKEKIHMGFELETRINGGHSDSDITAAARFAMEALQTPEIAEMKSDASIGGGFEIVTQPCTYEVYRDDMKLLWDTIDTLRKKYKARSWDAGTCGLHIHISRNAFRDGLHTHRFIEFIYRNSEMLMKFAGRKDQQYASFHDCWSVDKYERPEFNIEHKLAGKGARHTAVNTNNADTIELRFFRGTMNPSGVRSALGLVHAMNMYTRTMVPDVNAPRDRVFAWEPFSKWVEERASEYPDLMERMPLIKDFDIDNVPTIQA